MQASGIRPLTAWLWLPMLCELCGGISAQEQDPKAATPPERQTDWVGGREFFAWNRLTGNWGGARDWLEERGIEPNGGYTLDWSSVWDGGVAERSTASSLVDFNVAFRLDKLADLAGATVFVDVYDLVGRDCNLDSGTIWGTSSIAGASPVQLAEFWFEQKLWDDKLRFKLGKVDANSEFALLGMNGDLNNAGGVITPTILAMPTYPDPATSINVFLQPDPAFYAGLGVYDGALLTGVPTGSRGPKTFFDQPPGGGYFWIGEAGYQWAASTGTWGHGRLALGAWHHSGDFTAFDGSTDSGSSGSYLLFEQQVWRENEEDEQGIAFCSSLSQADQDVALVRRHLHASLIRTGPLPGRDADTCGVGINHYDLTNHPAAGLVGNETDLEVFYKFQLTPYFSVKPDLQYIINPSGDPTLDDALVGMIRFDLVF